LTAGNFVPGLMEMTANPKLCQWLAAFENGNKVSNEVIKTSSISGVAVFSTVKPVNN